MRIVSFDGGYGRLEGDTVHVLGESMAEFLDDADAAAASASVPLDAVSLTAPVYRPSKILSLGPNYPGEGGRSAPVPDSPERLTLFGMFANCVIGPGEAILIPPGVTDVDYEAELAVVVGRPLRVASVAEAAAGIAGYTCANDVSARAIQYDPGFEGLTRSKAMDTFLPLGPCLVTPEEIGDGRGLEVTAHLNGVKVQDFSTAEMFFGPAELLSSISRTITLLPGDVVTTGTGPGSGFTRDPPVWLEDGDEVTVEIGGIGVLRNVVRALER